MKNIKISSIWDDFSSN